MANIQTRYTCIFPEGLLIIDSANGISNLKESLHGLKKSLRFWRAKIYCYFIHDLSIRSSPNDGCTCVRHTSSQRWLIGFYVDNLIIPARNNFEITKRKLAVTIWFRMNDHSVVNLRLAFDETSDR